MLITCLNIPESILGIFVENTDIQGIKQRRFGYSDDLFKQDSKMRKRFEQHFILGRLPITETPVPAGKRGGALPKLVAALKELYITPKWNEQIFRILESRISAGKRQTGRPGMDLWQIFVLAQVRLVQNISYDELFHIANYDGLIRQLMGVESGFGYEKYQFEYQNIYDNVSLLDDEAVRELNQVILEFGHEVFKKKRGGSIVLKDR